MQVSFIIPLYNCLPLTRECLRTLHATLPAGLDHEIIFVDDGSTDGTREWLKNLGLSNPPPTSPFPYRFLFNEKNLGFAGACNRAADEAAGEILFFLNNDLEFLPGWFEPMLAALQQNRRIGIVGNRQIRFDNGALDHAGLYVTSRGKIKHLQVLPDSASRRPSLIEVPAVTAACLGVRRDLFQNAGKFDQDFFNGGEDVDFCLRVRARHGLATGVVLQSVIRHHVSAARGPTNVRDERNSRLLANRWRAELIRWGALTWAAEQPRPTLARLWTREGRDALGAWLYARSWKRQPPATGQLMLESALHREEIRWQRFLDLPPGVPHAPTAPGHYREERFFRDEIDPRTAWLRDIAFIELPAGFPVSNIFLNGHLLPAVAIHPVVDRPLGFRIRVNGAQLAEFLALPCGNFNCGLDAPFVLADRPTRIEVELIGVGWTNFLAWAGRQIAWLPLPPPWRRAVSRHRRQALNRRLRFAQLVCDDEVIFDFTRSPALALRLRLSDTIKGVNVIGWFRAAVGVGESARCMAKACDAAALPSALIDLRLNCLNREGDDRFAARLQEKSPYAVNVFHLDPPVSEHIDHHHGPELRLNRYNIAYWAWELPEFPEEWVRQSAFFEEIWCPSEYVRAALAAKVPLPVIVMPHAIDFPHPQGDARRRFHLPGARFLFLFVYDLNSYQERKNPLAVIDAYRRAFPGETGVGLVIKTQNRARHPAAFARLQTALVGLDHATLIDETLSNSDLHLLQSGCDAFVSLHRAEGFGLSVAECMFLGKPVISTDWSATAEFVNEQNGCPVRCSLIQLQESHGPYAKGQTWADPDVAHAAEWMGRLVGEPGLAARLGHAARVTIRERFAPTVIGALYQARLDTLGLWPR